MVLRATFVRLDFTVLQEQLLRSHVLLVNTIHIKVALMMLRSVRFVLQEQFAPTRAHLTQLQSIAPKVISARLVSILLVMLACTAPLVLL